MASFIGEYTCKLDDKGRVPFPAAFRPAAVSGDGAIRLVVQMDLFKKCLILMTEAEWERRMAEINQKLKTYNSKHQDLLDALMSDMAALEVDTAGRILLPKRLTEEVNISKEITFVGRVNEIKVWSKDFREKDRKPRDYVAALAEELLGNANPQT